MPPRKRQTKRKLHGSQAQSVKLSQNEPKLIAEDPPLVPEKKRKVPQASGIDVMSISPTISGGTIKIVPKKVNRKKEVSNRSDGKGNSDVAVEILSQPPSSNTNLNDSNDGSSNNTSTDSSSSSLTIAELVQRQSNISTPVMDASDTGVENNVISNEEILIATITNSVAENVESAEANEKGEEETEDEVDDGEEQSGSEEEEEGATETMSGQWVFECTFENKEKLDEFMEKEDWWSLRGSCDTVNGKKVLYRCNRVKRISKKQCDAGVYIVAKTSYTKEKRTAVAGGGNNGDDDEDRTEAITTYMLFRKEAPHTHDNLPDFVEKVPTYVQKLIIEQYANGRKAKKITFTLSDNGDIPKKDVPSHRQVVKVINAYKKSNFGETPITMRQLCSFVEKHSNCPENIDEAFIVQFEKSPRNVQHDKFFRMFISTPRLLQQARFGKILHSDATHKVTTEKLPLIAVGVTDNNRNFHFSGLTLTNHETSADFALTFSGLKAGVKLVTGVDMQPTVLVCDADTSIHNGFKKVFSPNGGVDAESEVDDSGSDSDVDSAGSDNANNVAVQQQFMQHLIVMCYFHVTLNIQNKYKFKDAKNKAMFKDDVRMLHLCDNEKKFDIGCALFVKKWKRTEPEPTRLLQKSFFKKHRNWYIGVAPRIPKTNNHMETFNSTMKRCQTEHQRQPLKQFLQTALAIVRQRSKEYWKDKASFQHELLISDEIIAQGRELKRNYVYDTAKANGEMDFYMFRSGIHENITLPDVRVFYNETYETFDEFTAHGFDIYKITFPQETAKWQDALCTCPAYDTNYMCKHIISIANSLALLPPVEEEDYDDDPLFVSRRGRPKRTTKALVKEQ